MTKPFVRKHNVPLYGVRFYLSFADSLTEANKALPHVCDGIFDVNVLSGGAAAVTTTSDEDGIVAVIFTRKHFSVSIIAHEALHASLGILRIAGVGPMQETNEEAYAYVMTWVVDRALDAWRIGGKSAKKGLGYGK